MSGLIPSFTTADIGNRIDAFHQAKVKKTFELLSYMGIKCVNYAKKNRGYQDQTGNLTQSIGYAVIYDGVIKTASMMHEEGAKVVDELAGKYSTGMVLVVVAGMEYAAAVESKGYDVITGASYYAKSELAPFMKAGLGAEFS